MKNPTAMKISKFKNLMRALLVTGLIAASSHSTVLAQNTSTQTPSANDSVNVTDDMMTWVQVMAANGIDIPSGADGVVINNGVGGQITASLNAIVTEADTTVINAGNISGGTNAINFVNGQGSGSVTNAATGVISSDSRAINIGGSVDVDNAGQIVGTGNQRNGTVYADALADNFSVRNRHGGVIDAGAGNEGSGVGAEIGDPGDGANTFSLTNAGKIQGRGNAGAATSGAGDGVRIGNVGNIGVAEVDIDNSGTINSEGANGTVAGIRFVNGISFDGVLDNSGVISGTQNGLYFGNPVNGQGADHSNGVVNNSGTISSGSRALNVDGLGLTINNDGLILGTGDQRNGTVYADSTAQDFVLNNRGTIDAGQGNQGAGFSVELSETGSNFTINNSGDLRGRGLANAGLATAGDGIRLERSRVGGAFDGTTTGLFTGVINNTGTISSEANAGTTGGFRAVNGVSFQGTLNNAGTISGVNNGVYFGNPVGAGGADHTGGVVNNFGTISSDSRAFNLDGIGLQVNNDGDIVATGAQRNGTFYVDGTADNFSLNNSGSIDASGGSGSGVSIQVGSFDGDVQTGSIVNRGEIIGNGDSGVDAAIRLFTNANTATFSGDIVNEAGALLFANGSPAVLIEDDVVFDGTFVNGGEIDGSVFLGSGDLDLLETSILSLAASSYSDFDTVSVTGNINFGGSLNLDILDPFSFQVGQTLDLFDFGSATGSFDSVFAGPLSLDLSNLNSRGTVSISAIAVPEPSSVSLIGLGLVASLCRRRK